MEQDLLFLKSKELTTRSNIIKAMEERQSIRKFKSIMPPKDDLEQIIEAGLYAANGMGDWEGIGHCAVGYVEGDIPKAAKRKDGRVYWID
mgnify:CR=1 FL=1